MAQREGCKSTQVLLALIDIDLFKQMSQAEIDHVTSALITEIDSDPQLKQRLTNAVSLSASEILTRKRQTTE